MSKIFVEVVCFVSQSAVSLNYAIVLLRHRYRHVTSRVRVQLYVLHFVTNLAVSLHLRAKLEVCHFVRRLILLQTVCRKI